MLYIHIPYCKKACVYCDFHFSVNTSSIDQMVSALCSEIELRSHYLEVSDSIKTIYFGGGTPSLLSIQHLDQIFNSVYRHYKLDSNVEITLEANPDDLDLIKLEELSKSPINRLSIGVQSFLDEELEFMGRAHNADEALGCIRHAAELGYENISIDLIYGIPVGGLGNWAQNLHQAFSLPIQHLSCYGMTIEPRTRLYQMVSKGALVATSDEAFAEQFGYLMDLAVTHGFEHYEISNFAKPGFRSGHNSRYWNDDSYLGIGPSAHSYNGFSRQWNVSSNAAYIDSISKGVIPATSEELSIHDKYNEFVMTRLRTLEGVNMVNLFERFGSSFQNNFLSVIGEYCQQGYVVKEGSRFFLSRSGQFIADRIASDLFVVNGGKVT